MGSLALAAAVTGNPRCGAGLAKGLRSVRRPWSALWIVGIGLVALVGFTIAPTTLGAPNQGDAAGNAPGATVPVAAAPHELDLPPAVGTISISAGGVSSDPTVVATIGSTATVLESFDGNLTDAWANSVLEGQDFLINATSYSADANSVAVLAGGITVREIETASAGSTDGIFVGAAVSSATIEASTVTLGTGSTTAIGIQAGNFQPATAVEPTGSFVVTGSAVTGPGAGGVAGESGIAVYGAGVTVSADSVTGFSLETTTTSGGNTYSSWFEDTQSVGIFVGCAGGASICEVDSNTVTGDAIGVAYGLLTSSFSSITPAAAPTLFHNTVTNSVAYGLVAEPTGASGTTTVEGNTFADPLSGAPAAFLLGTTFSVTGNTFIGTSATGSNGALQGEDGCAAASIVTASVEASDCFNPVTQVTLNANVFESTSAPLWDATYPTNPTSSLQGGELVTFTESGLSVGTDWSVTVAGTLGSALSPNALVFDSANGSIAYTVGSVAGWYQETIAQSGSISVAGAPVDEPALDYELVAPGQVYITNSCISTDPALVSLSGRSATVLASFSGNITDNCSASTLNGNGFRVSANAYPDDTNVVGLLADGITVDDLSTISGGSTDGIVANVSVTSATIVSCTVTLAADGTTGVGVQAGNVLPATAVEPTGTFAVKSTTVVGPGDGGTAGEIGILVYGASVTVSNDTVSNFPLVTTSTLGANTYTSWFEDTQSVGIFAGCASGSVSCSIRDNVLDQDAIGIVDTLVTSSFGSITPAAATIEDNTVTDALAYGLVAEPTGASGTTTVEGNTFADQLSGAPAAFLLGTTFSVTGNTFVGTSATGSNGALQGEDGCAAASIPTASVEASDCFNPVTQVILNDNVFESTPAALWDATYPTNPSSTLHGGELVTFTESGLAVSTDWSVTVGGTTGTVAAPTTLEADAANGTVAFSVARVVGYVVTPRTGSLTVAGAPIGQAVTFTLYTYAVEFQELGLPGGTTWNVTVDAVKHSSVTATIVAYLGNGTFSWRASSPAGYVASPGTVNVAGEGELVDVDFTVATYPLTFTETGLATATGWWLNLSDAESFHAWTQRIRVLEPNGTYGYTAAAPNSSARQHIALGGTVTVLSAEVNITVPFQVYYPVTVRQGSLPPSVEWWVNVSGGPSIGIVGHTWTFYEPRGTYHYTVGTTDKIYASPGGTFRVGHSGVVTNAHLVEQRFRVVLTETGLPTHARWCVVITAGARHCSSRPTLSFQSPNGTYSYTVSTARAGYSAPAGAITVVGRTYAGTIAFTG